MFLFAVSCMHLNYCPTDFVLDSGAHLAMCNGEDLKLYHL